MIKIIRSFFVIFGVFILTASFLSVQALSLGVANTIPINDKKVTDGSIVSSYTKGFFLSRNAYDPFMFGVVSSDAAINFVGQGNQGEYPVVSKGIVQVNVSTSNGIIKKGDYLTSSTIPGVAMKSTKSGYILGVALENSTEKNQKTIGKIRASLNITYFATKPTVSSSLFDILNLSTIATYEEPIRVLKYVVAAFVIILSFVLGFSFFGKTAIAGIEALGRNPLARRFIEVGIFFNVLMSIAIVAAGFIMAIFILRL